MSFQVEICNMALSFLGIRERIGSLTENSQESKMLGLVYDQTLKRVLRSHDWGFARKRKALTLIETDPNTDWKFRYEMPADCVRPLRYANRPRNVPNEDEIVWNIESMPDEPERRTLLTDEVNAILVYTRGDVPTALYPEHFNWALEWSLAEVTAMSLTGGKVDVGQYAMNGAIMARMEGASVDGNTKKPDQPLESEFVRARD